MAASYQIDPNRNIPIYRQLADAICADIKSGRLEPGARIPTVRELAEELGVARGTVKRTYDELQQERVVEKIQGRGTFVCYQPKDSDSRKERAMRAIEELLGELDSLGFSMSEMSIFLNLKLRERVEHQAGIRVAVVECNPEILFQLSEQLRGIKQVDIYTYLLSDVMAYPYKLGEDMDLIITTAEHASVLSSVIPERRKIVKIALMLTPRSVTQIIKLQAGETVGILCGSERFGSLIYDVCTAYTEGVTIEPPLLMNRDTNGAAFLQGKSTIILPEGYERFCGNELMKQLKSFGDSRELILCAYRVDEGSLIYLCEKIDRLLESRQI